MTGEQNEVVLQRPQRFSLEIFSSTTFSELKKPLALWTQPPPLGITAIEAHSSFFSPFLTRLGKRVISLFHNPHC